MTSDADIAWLAGFFDGEGSLSLIYTNWRGERRFISPIFQVMGTNEDNLKRVKAIVSEMVGHEVRYRPGSKGPSTKGLRPSWYLKVTKQETIATICTALLPHLTGKKPQAELMLQYLVSSPAATHTRGAGVLGNTGYTEDHQRMVSTMKHLNRRYARGEWTLLQQETELTAPESRGEETIRTP